ncbi:MAG: alpha/beta hydrolase [Alphaproteobacteria bacterium]|nr:alpha/beta hydrolase [Alphaproteobacteria bacterium]
MNPLALLPLLVAAPAADALPPAPLPAGRPVTIGTSYEIASAVLGDRRRINVALPADYGRPGRRFAVLYLLDGGEREDFVHIAALTRIAAAYGQGEELIVVGVEGVDRRHDLTSPSSIAADRRRVPTGGGAEAYRHFLRGELKPWVAARFRTNGRSALIGESLAGLFVLETYLKRPELFDDYIAVSPSLWWNGGKLVDGAEADLSLPRPAGRRLFLAFETPAPPADAAARERAEQDRLAAALRRRPTPGVTVARSPEGHGSVYHPAAWQALRTLYATSPAP